MDKLYYDVLEVDKDSLYLLVSLKGWVAISAFNETLSVFLAPYQGASFSEEIVAPYKQALQEYFEGTRITFDQPIDLLGRGTLFQQAVWQGLTQIPYGQTASYGEIARLINRPKAIRAVGTAIGKNPLRIIQPCHRVIRLDGSIGHITVDVR